MLTSSRFLINAHMDEAHCQSRGLVTSARMMEMEAHRLFESCFLKDYLVKEGNMN